MQRGALRGWQIATALLLVAGCVACTGDKGDTGPEGQAGTEGQPGSPGADGTSCTVEDNGDGTKTISCTDGMKVIVSDGSPGTDGTSCAVADNGDGTSTITCEDGTTVTVSDGALSLPGLNVAAIHDADAEAYDANCVACHANKLTESSLDSDVAGFHRVAIERHAFAGDTPNEQCVYCHTSVDFTGGQSAGNLRRSVDVSLCAGCHSAGPLTFFAGE